MFRHTRQQTLFVALIVSLAAAAAFGCSSDSRPAQQAASVTAAPVPAATASPGTVATTSPTASTAAPAPSSAPANVPAGNTVAAPSCSGAATPAQTEGPYYKAGSPERTSLIETGTTGTKLVLTGYVLTRDCNPVPGAWLDFWQADSAGAYDNTGFLLRGFQYADASGRFQLETVVPGEYPGRTVHIHVKVRAPGGSTLTTQLYLPDVAANARDSIFTPASLMTVTDTAGGKLAAFNFVLNM